MISTPISPTAVAIQRRTPTFSHRKKIDSAVTNSGATKPVAEASAIGRYRSPEMKNSDDPTNAAPRINCRPRRSVRNANSGDPGNIAGNMINANGQEPDPGDLDRGQCRRQIFRRHVRGPEEYGRSRISAMPLNG